MPKIFISHSSKDNDFAKQLADSLRERGAEVWIDLSDISAGKNWGDEIQQGLDACELMILVISPDSMASKHVAREWQYYDDDNKPIIPVIWLPVEKLNFQIRRLQYVMFHEQDYDAAFVKLGAELARWSLGLTVPPQKQTPASLRIEGGEKDVRQFPLIIKPDWVGKIIPAPFEWCVVPAGKVTLGKGGYLKEATTFDVPEFQIARYPITNAVEAFVNAKDGWRDAAWWDYSDKAKAWRAQNEQSEAAGFSRADCPRETVTWYAVVAFTRWLSAKTGENIALSSDQQWQRAAQGDDGRAYPWSNDWEATNCNTDESKIGKTTPVTQYPHGASPYGVLDMSGNVWEWCLTDYNRGYNDSSMNVEYRVLRGGSWYNLLDFARVAFRGSNDPYDRYFSIGFRVVVSSPIS